MRKPESHNLLMQSFQILTILWAWVLLSAPTHIRAQAKTQSTETAPKDPRDLILEADRLAWLGNWAMAEPLYAEAETRFTEARDARNALYAKIGRIRGQSETMSWPEVSAYFAGELENPIVQNDPKLRLWCLVAKGYTDLEIAPSSAQRVWEQALALAKSQGDKAWETRASGELGIIAFLNGDSAKALRLVGGALMSAMATGDVGEQVRLLSIIGDGLSELNRHEQALGYFDRALQLAESTKDAGFPFMAYEGKADALAGLNKRAEAKQLLDHALEQSRLLSKRGHEAQLLVLLGKFSMAGNERQQGIEYLENAAALATAGEFYRTLAEAELELGQAYRASGELAKAEERLVAGVEASRQVGDTYYLPRDLARLAEVKVMRGKLKQADALYEQATDVVDGMLVNMPSSYARSSLVGAMSEIYLGHFALPVQQKDVHRAFEILERARGRTAADILRSRSSLSAEQPPNASPVEREIVELQIRLMRATKPRERKEVLEKLFVAEQKLSLVVEARSASKGFSSAKPVKLEKLQASLRPDELILEYVLSEPSAFCVTIARNQANVFALASGRKHLEDLIDRYLAEVKSKTPALETGRELYSLLLGFIPEQARKFRLIVVPDGKLHLLPIDSLRDPSGRYVLYSHLVTYAPSATVLYLLRTARSTEQATLPFLGVGDVDYGLQATLAPNSNESASSGGSVSRGLYDFAGTRFPRLPGTRQEVVSSAEIFGKKSVVLLGRDATEAAFKSQPLADFRVIHLAAHGIADTKFPERAALVLGIDPASREDGLLQVREISALRLNADLVTLSACDTGVGRLQGEEGIANLVRAFLLAGAKTVVATLWSADDTFAPALIKEFYLRLSQGQDKGSALQQAKIDLLKEYGDQALPYYWAGFTLQGEAASTVPASQ